MKKFIALALLSAVIAAPAFADDTPQGVATDVGAVQKDNVAIAHDNANLAANRAAKAKAKANGDLIGQASSSVKIGANKTAKSEKSYEKGVDKDALDQDAQDSKSK